MIEKDFRALLPTWLACAVAMVACKNQDSLLRDLGIPIYFFGAATLGALSVGHEYSHHTLATLLSLPIRRNRVWLSKLAVLTTFLAGLAVLAGWTVWVYTPDRWMGIGFYVVPALAALCLAPWLTMVCRSPLAGSVFALTPVGALVVLAQWISWRYYGYTHEASVVRTTFMSSGMLLICAAGAVLGWRKFVTLEVPDGRGTDVDLAFVRGSRAATSRLTKRSPIWQVIVKELRLQQVSYLVAGLYVLTYLAAVFSRQDQSTVDDVATIATTLYALIVGLLIGSLACAEERSYGTLDSQLLLPLSSARQWMLKTGTALSLTVLLAIVLPLTMIWLLPPRLGQQSMVALRRIVHDTPMLWIIAVATVGLFVSSFAVSGMRALLLSIPAVAGLIAFVTRVALPLRHRTLWVVYELGRGKRWPSPMVSKDVAAVVVLLCIAALVLRFGLSNYRTSDRSPFRVGMQVLWTAVAIGAWAIIAGALAVL